MEGRNDMLSSTESLEETLSTVLHKKCERKLEAQVFSFFFQSSQADGQALPIHSRKLLYKHFHILVAVTQILCPTPLPTPPTHPPIPSKVASR